MERTEQCDKCYWFLIDDDAPGEKIGRCKRYAPRYLGAYHKPYQWDFPRMKAIDYCGEFRENLPETKKGKT